MNQDEIVFLRRRDYKLLKELGSGACGKTVLLLDPELDEKYVCKKYAPQSEEWRTKLFPNFLTEIKVLHRLNHNNVVRIFNHFIRRDIHAGYILMEYVDGLDIHSHLAAKPEDAGSIFAQVVSGFRHLEENRILHRDIRAMNILVSKAGVVKIIDFGFGKAIAQTTDFNRSVSLNWWCETPNEFAHTRYDFSTEVYFIGKLFEAAIREYGIDNFPHTTLLGKMVQKDPETRISSFVAVDQEIATAGFSSDDFSPTEVETYRRFSTEVRNAINKLEYSAQFESDVAKVELKLEKLYRDCLLEVLVPDTPALLHCFLRGNYYYDRKQFIKVSDLKEFLGLLKSCSKAKKNIVLANLQTKLNAAPKYSESVKEDVPF